MRECSPDPFAPAGSLNGSRTGAKSLFRNILPLSPCGSRFCPDHSRSELSNPFGINILGILAEKMGSGPVPQSSAKSLFWKILPLSCCRSRFCKHEDRAPTSKSLRMNILEKWTEKMCSVDSRGVRRTISSRRQGSETRPASPLGFRESSTPRAPATNPVTPHVLLLSSPRPPIPPMLPSSS